MNVFQKLGHILKGRSFRIPNIKKLPAIGVPSFAKFPSVGFGNSRIKYVVGGSVLVSGAAVVVGLYFAVYDIASATYEWPRAGAVYAELDQGHTLGQPLPAEEDGTESQTLLIMLASGARLSSLTLTNLDVGKTGLVTPCFQIARDSSNTTGFLYVDQFTITGMTAPSFDMATTEISSMTISAYTDGHTNSATIDQSVSEQIILSTRDTGDFKAQDSVVDRVIIQFLGDATIGQLLVDDFACSISATADGAVDIDHVKAGNLTIDSTSKFGDGDGIDTADFIVNSTVKVRSYTDNIVDAPITIR